MQLNISPLRKASALFLFSEAQSPKDSNLLMIKRLRNMSFANLYVVPGGVCDQEDKIQAHSNIFQEYGKITAIRECFQETGILIYPSKFKITQQLLAQSDEQIIKQIGTIWKDSLNKIVPIIRFITPQFEKGKRFDCQFFVAKLSPQIKSINVKIVQKNKNRDFKQYINYFDQISINFEQSSAFLWDRPQKIINKAINDRKNLSLSPPQIIILISLMNCPDFEALGKLIQICAQPIMFQIRQSFFPLILPGDSQYRISEVIEKQKQTESKRQIIKSFEQNHKRQKKDNISRKIVGPPFKLMVSKQQKSLLQYMPTKQFINKSKL